MEENIKKIQQAMNDYIVNRNFEKCVIYDNVGLFYKISTIIESLLSIFSEENEADLDFSDVKKILLFEKIDLIKSFYQQNNINFDIDKYINDGTIDFLFQGQTDYTPYYYLIGRNYYQNNHKLVDICENGVITDSVIAIHELSHLRNQPNHRRSQISDLLTEPIAYAEGFIFMDYLEELGFEKECYLMKKHIFSTLYSNVKQLRIAYKILLLYKELGDISISSYELFYGESDSYDEFIDNILKLTNNKNYDLYFESWYLFAPLLSSYMYQQYKKDHNYINNINLLHERINDSDMLECLKIMGLNELGEEDRKILADCLKETISFYDKDKEKTLQLK